MTQENNLLKTWCQRDQIDYVLANALKNKIFPLLEEAHKQHAKSFDRAFLEQKKGMRIREENSARLLNILHTKLDPKNFTLQERQALSLHLEFLPLVEGFFATQINFLIFLLIADKHDFFSVRKERYVKTLSEIEEEDLANKLKFLKEHNFPELSKDDSTIRKLRNGAAHVFYEIDSNNILIIKKEKIEKRTYDFAYDQLRNIAFAIQNITNLFYVLHMQSLSPQQIEDIKTVNLEEVTCTCGYVNLLPDNRKTINQKFNCTKCNELL